jgi:imidazolonepropionase
MAILIKNASQILTMNDGIGLQENVSLITDKSKIKGVGAVSTTGRCTVINARGCTVIPGFVDSHTHLVYGGSREDEFAMRVAGVSYEKISKKGGGIASTVAMTREASEKELYNLAVHRLKKLMKHGTTTIEIKSGYGLSLSEELKTLRVIKKLKKNSVLDIVPTYLVHTILGLMKRRDYIDLVCEEMIPEVAKNKLAVFCDIFCDKLAFTKKESEKILLRAKQYNFKLKIHADQFANSGGAHLAAKLKCASADHLEYTTKSGIKAMKEAGVIPTLLPGVAFFIQMKKRPNVRTYRKLKSPVAIASDYNPGSCMIYAMPKIIAIACITFGMTVEDALIGATRNGARALNMFHKIGSIEKGKQADLVVLDVDNYRKIPYQFGEDIVKYTIKNGRIVYGKNC